MRIALTGISGQIGSQICSRFLDMGFTVFGLKRRSSSFNTSKIDHLMDHSNLKLIYGDITDYASIISFINQSQPDIFINCAAQSHVQVSQLIPHYTANCTGVGVLNCLEAIRTCNPKIRFVQMSSSEQFGSNSAPQNEKTPMMGRSVYACAKIFGYNTTVHYREIGLFCSNLIAFNTESKLRSETFYTRKVSRAAARIYHGLDKELVVGNLLSKRSFNHVQDLIDAMILIMNADKPDDFVVGHNQMITMEEFAKRVFNKVGLNYKDYIMVDKKYFRNAEVDALEPDATKIKTILGWKPKYNVDDIINEMIEYDLELALKEKLLSK